MPYTHEDVQLAILGSRSSNQMRTEIHEFLSMFVNPYEEAARKKYGKFQELSRVQLNGCELVIATNKSGLGIAVVDPIDTRYQTIESLRMRCVENVWLNLHKLLDALVELVPEIQNNIDFFRDIGRRTAARDTSS